MGLATTYWLPSLFRLAFRGLADMSLTQLTKGQCALIGPDIVISVALAKSVLDKHCRIIAAEEPHIISHANDCQDCRESWYFLFGSFYPDTRF